MLNGHFCNLSDFSVLVWTICIYLTISVWSVCLFLSNFWKIDLKVEIHFSKKSVEEFNLNIYPSINIQHSTLCYPYIYKIYTLDIFLIPCLKNFFSCYILLILKSTRIHCLFGWYILLAQHLGVGGLCLKWTPSLSKFAPGVQWILLEKCTRPLV